VRPIHAKGPRSRRRGDVVEIDVTELVPGDPVRYGLLTRPGPRPSAVLELERLLARAD
jgi:hypothetical protein